MNTIVLKRVFFANDRYYDNSADAIKIDIETYFMDVSYSLIVI